MFIPALVKHTRVWSNWVNGVTLVWVLMGRNPKERFPSDKALSYDPRCEKADLRGIRPGLTQTRLYGNRRRLKAWNFGFSKKRDCTICVAKTKVLISFAVTAKLICVFVFAYAKSRFSHNEAHIIWHKNVFSWLGSCNQITCSRPFFIH